ncbi:hypothetical protein Ga0061060_1345 [Anoxybacillus suryakundensis]|uniref:Transposase n=1 Tax=Anoxybacillus suryakundensis TaxID=1325335 RepID=A0A0K6GS45_9BACL|nr:hypothetical protein Ga0061060_1345 [Anoxybacillus suryakundensis]
MILLVSWLVSHARRGSMSSYYYPPLNNIIIHKIIFVHHYTIKIVHSYFDIYIPTLFGTNEHAVYNQLFAAFIAYVLLRWLYPRTEKRTTSSLSFLSFVRRFFSGQLPLEWKSEMAAVLFEYTHISGRSMPNFG